MCFQERLYSTPFLCKLHWCIKSCLLHFKVTHTFIFETLCIIQYGVHMSKPTSLSCLIIHVRADSGVVHTTELLIQPYECRFSRCCFIICALRICFSPRPVQGWCGITQQVGLLDLARTTTEGVQFVSSCSWQIQEIKVNVIQISIKYKTLSTAKSCVLYKTPCSYVLQFHHVGSKQLYLFLFVRCYVLCCKQ